MQNQNFQSNQHHEQLLSSAQQQFNDGDYRECIVLEHIAIEMVADQALVQWISTINPSGLRSWLLKQIENNHNLGTTKASKLYEALSGDMISETDFWPVFLQGNQLRNTVMHEGIEVSKEQAEQVLANTKTMIGHLLAHLPTKSN